MHTSEQQSLLLSHYTDLLIKQHNLIDHHAVQIVKKLKDSKYQAYLVGGGVRDLLVHMKPKDFDIATSASPQEVRKKVSNSFIIGRRFKLVHAKRGDSIYEVATFRRAATTEELETTEEDDRRLVEENFFGNLEEDSFRRDFTINSLYYDPIAQVIVDHCDGLRDIKNGMLRMIGDPATRLREDPIRILRAIRLSQKLNFSIDPELRQQILELKTELLKTAPPRRREEWIKFLRLEKTDLALMELFDLGVMQILLPSLHNLFLNDELREEFLCYIRQIPSIGFDLTDTSELFSAVLTSYLSVTKSIKQSLDDFAEDEKFIIFCRDELGVFKAEAGVYFQALQFIKPLLNVEAYLKRGERRKRSMLQHTSFFLSLKIAYLSGQLDICEMNFWLNEYENLMTESTNQNTDS